MSGLKTPAWMEQALCAQTDPELFFPDKGGSSRPAIAICGRCEVREQCLQLAIDNGDEYGIYGGLSPKHRRGIGKGDDQSVEVATPERNRPEIVHGSPYGARTHHRRGEKACDACRAAETARRHDGTTPRSESTPRATRSTRASAARSNPRKKPPIAPLVPVVSEPSKATERPPDGHAYEHRF